MSRGLLELYKIHSLHCCFCTLGSIAMSWTMPFQVEPQMTTAATSWCAIWMKTTKIVYAHGHRPILLNCLLPRASCLLIFIHGLVIHERSQSIRALCISLSAVSFWASLCVLLAATMSNRYAAGLPPALVMMMVGNNPAINSGNLDDSDLSSLNTTPSMRAHASCFVV
jgi:hypothetical protein